MAEYIDASLAVEMQLYDYEHEEWSEWNGTIEALLNQWTDQGCPPTIEVSTDGEVSTDCISRADAINVRCAHCDTPDCCRDCSELGILLSLPAVTPTESTGEWIPCNERLPNAEYGEGDLVLCCTESGLMYILYWNGGNWCIPTGEPHHWVNHKTGWHDKVIAWMPLPEPYKGGEE